KERGRSRGGVDWCGACSGWCWARRFEASGSSLAGGRWGGLCSGLLGARCISLLRSGPDALTCGFAAEEAVDRPLFSALLATGRPGTHPARPLSPVRVITELVLAFGLTRSSACGIMGESNGLRRGAGRLIEVGRARGERRAETGGVAGMLLA